MKKFHHVAYALLTGASTLVLASTASAQAAAGAENAETLQEVVVTGSRVIQNGDDSPTPVTVVSTEQLLQTTPRTVVEGLLTLPVFAGGRSPQTNPGNSSQNGSYRSLNLRNIGVTRTLVLFDSKRVMTTTPQGEVDADFVPSLLLQRVDVVTGGASAVYGSDAVSGVVNFVTDRGYNGMKVDGHYGISARNDGPEAQVGIAGGMDILGGRGHIEGSLEYFNSPGIFTKAGRTWGAQVITVNRANATSPYHLVYDTRLNSVSYGGYILPGNLAALGALGGGLRDMTFSANGVLTPFRHGTAVASGIESGGDGAYYERASLLQKDQHSIAFGRFDFDVSDNTHFYAEVTGMNKHNENNHQDNELRNWCLSTKNPYLSAAQQALFPASLASVGTAGTNGFCPANTFLFGKEFLQIGVLQPDAVVKAYSAQFALDGKFGDKYKWELFYVPSVGSQFTKNNNNIDNAKMAAASDAVLNSAGQIVCQASLSTDPVVAARFANCAPINMFGPTSESQAAINYVTAVTKFTATTKQHDVGGSITGAPFDSWAGPVNMAFSAEWHTTHYDVASNALAVAPDCTGIRFNCPYPTSPLAYVSNVLNNQPGAKQTVYEGAYEFDLPLLKDAAFAKGLNLNGAVRYANYNNSSVTLAGTTFSANTWKVGLDYHINDQFTIRATRSRDIRAPNLIELYNPRLINPAGVNDVHTGITGSAPFITDPNPNLVPEKADTYTAGIVLRPSFIPSFSVAIDYYQMRIGNAITTIQGQNVTIQTICENSGGTSPYCALIQRPLPFSDHSAANFVTAFYSQPQNAQSTYVRGADFEVNYAHSLLGGQFSVRGLMSYQPELATVQFVGAPRLNAAGAAGLPTERATVFLKYKRDNTSVDVQERWSAGTWWQSDRTLGFSEPSLPSVAYTALTISHDIPDYSTQIYLSINNLFDKQPTPYGNIGGASGVPGLFGGNIPGEDIIGRYFTLGFRYRSK
jgi:outer membrane receptor protein involved in Fe transport